MTTERPQPPRITDVGPAPLRELVRTERMHGPSDEALARISKRLVSTTEAPLPSKLVHKLGVVAIVLGGGLLLTRSGPLQTPVVPGTETATTTIASPPPPEPPAARAHELAPVSVDDLPPAPRAPARPRNAAAAPPSPSSTTAVPEEAELEVLQRAEAALPVDAGRALRIAREHERAYPTGEFVQEREVIAVEALARLGRDEEASQRARDLLRRFPRTPYAARLGAALGRPLPRTSVEDAHTTPAQ